jgi:hypothetical protein
MKFPRYVPKRGNSSRIFARAGLGDYAQCASILIAIFGLIYLNSQVKIAQQTLDLSFHPTVEAESVSFGQVVPLASQVSVKFRNTGTSDAVHLQGSVTLSAGALKTRLPLPVRKLGVGESTTIVIPIDPANTTDILNGKAKMFLVSEVSFDWPSSSRSGASCAGYLFDPAQRQFVPALDCGQ